jgi:hypothetical protein
MRGNFFPGCVRLGGKQFIHGSGFLFAVAAADIGANDIGRKVLGRAMQPARQDSAVRKIRGVLGEGYKHSLRDVLRQMPVANHAQRSGIDEVNVASDQFAEGGFRVESGIILQQLLIGPIVHS